MAGQPIKDKPLDRVVTLKDKLLGSDSEGGETYNYEIQDVVALAEAVAGGVTSTTNIIEIQETVTKDYLQVLNEQNPAWGINPADLPFVYVKEHTTSAFKALYIYKKASTSTIKIGVAETPVSAADFISVRLTSDFGEVNTLGEAGTGDVSLVTSKSGAELRVKSLKAGSNMSLTEDGTSITINTNGSLGEANTMSSAGGTSLYKTKTALELIIKGLTGSYCTIGGNTDDVQIKPWGKIVRTASFTVSATDSQRTIHIDNGATPVVITIPDTLSVDFEMAVQQIGTGEVSFAVSGGATLEYAENKLKGSGATCLVETLGNDATRILITGGTKA